MANGFAQLDDNQDESPQKQDDSVSPGVIQLLAADYSELPYEEGISKLKNDYSTIKWSNKEEAAKSFAEAADSFHKYHEVVPDSGIKETFADTLKYVLTESHTDEEKLSKIDTDYDTAIKKLYANTDDVETLAVAGQREKELDALRLYLRRGVISKDTSRMVDMIARGADTFLSPLAGTADAAFDTDFRKSLQEYTTETTRPDLDDSMLSMGASFVGSIAGFGVSTLIPGGPALYLAASLVNQSKEVYDTVLAETGDKTSAENAMLESVPANVLDALVDRVVGGAFWKLLKGKGSTLGAVKGALSEGGTEAIQEYAVGKVLSKYTGNPAFTPEESTLLKIFAVGGVVGGAVGAAGSYMNIKAEQRQQLLKNILENKPIEYEGRTIENPQGWLNTIRTKIGRFQIINQISKRTGKPVEEIAAQENASTGMSIFQDIANNLANHATVQSPTDEVSSISDAQTVPETTAANTDTAVRYHQLTEDQVSSIGLALDAYKSEAPNLEPGFSGDDVPPLNLLIATEDYDLITELISDSVGFRIHPSVVEDYYNNHPFLKKQAAKEYEAYQKDKLVKGVSFPGTPEEQFNKLTEPTYIDDNDIISKPEQVELQKLQQRKEQHRWLPEKQEERLQRLLEKQDLTNRYNESLSDKLTTPPEPSDAGRKKKVPDVSGLTFHEQNFGLAWPGNENAASFVFGRYVANEMGIEMSTSLLEDGGLGSHLRKSTDTPSKLQFLKDLFRNPQAFLKVWWHEFSHALDMEASIQDGIVKDPVKSTIAAHKTNPAFNKFVRVYRDFQQAGLEEDAEQFDKEVFALNLSWMPYEVGLTDYSMYRSLGTEQFANAMAALLTNPGKVRDSYPAVWKAFGKAVDAHPRLKEIMTLVERSKTDPTVLAEVFTDIRREGQDEESRIVNEAAKKRLTAKQEAKRALPKEAIESFGRSLFSSFYHARSTVDAIVQSRAMTREEAEQSLFLLQATSTAYLDMDRLVDRPLHKMRNDLLASVKDEPEVAIRNLANFLDVNHLLHDTNVTVDGIKQSPNSFKNGLKVISTLLKRDKWMGQVRELDGEDLVQKMSALLIELPDSTRETTRTILLSKLAELDTYIAKHQKDVGPAVNEEGDFDLETVDTDLEKQKKIQEAIKEYVDTHYAIQLLDKDAFSVRRLMDSHAVDGNSLNALWDSMKRRVGYNPESGELGDWKHYDKAIKEIHQIGYKAIDAMDKAGLLDGKTKDKLVRNVESYAPQNVLKYFEKDPRMPASIRKAYGSLDMTGNSITSYAGKMKALLMRAAFQETQNNAVKLARVSGTSWRVIDPKKHYGTKNGQPKVYYENIFDTRVLLEQKNPDKSYFITANKGKLELIELDDPNWAKMFSEGKLKNIPAVAMLTGVVDAFNKLTLAHWTKTLGSLPFALGSKFYDISREATVAGSKEVNLTHLLFWPRHWDAELNNARKQLKASVIKYRSTGEMDPYLKRFFDYGGSPDALTREYGGITDKTTFEHQIYKDLGMDVPGLEDASTPDFINKKGIELLRKLPFIKYTEDMAQVDELTTKLMGFWIGENRLGKGPQESAYMARNWFGTPDPSNSGTEMGTINKLFLFSRSNANGCRALLEIAKDDPQKFAFQYTYRKLIPRMMVSAAFMGPIIGALFGEDEEEIYRKFCNKLPSYAKIGKHIISLGFVDEKGNKRYFGDFTAKDIAPGWRAAAIAIPMERGLITIDQAVTPAFNFIENLLDTGTISMRRIAEDVAASFSQIFGSNMSPGLQAVWHLGGSEVTGTPSIWRGNPQDYFRKKGILSKDVAEAGTLYQKFSEYAMWSLYQSYPSLLGFLKPSSKQASEPTSIYDVVTKFPQLGTALDRFLLVSNYGDIETLKEAQAFRDELNSTLRLSMGEDTKKVMKEASAASGMMSGFGKAGEHWKDKVSDTQRRKISTINRWKSHYYTPALEDMRDAHLVGDFEKEEEIRNRLERNSTRFLEQLKTY